MKSNKGFTLLEIIISLAILSAFLGALVYPFSFFREKAKLAEAKEVFETILMHAQINALTGKSHAADFYSFSDLSDDLIVSNKFTMVSKYLLYFEKGDSWEEGEDGKILYVELRNAEQIVDAYNVLSFKSYSLPNSTFLQEILFSDFNPTGSNSSHMPTTDLDKIMILFEPPFAKVTFITDTEKALILKEKTGSGLVNITGVHSATRQIKSVEEKDLLTSSGSGIYLDFSEVSKIPGRVEFAIQYKNRGNIEAGDGDDIEKYTLRKYIRFDSNNQISNFWN
ncbi:hypothetical protein COB57_01415 [Candidatus Peregrinibacteria bacterium]|nr:MAG: hypothetical protein COB57_01415 [Candidatus Peregrinibacteria bacterium]